MDDTFKEFEDYIYKNVPIAHFEFPTEDFDDFVSAARWAWSCLENLAKIFCQLHCDRKICSFIMPPPLQPDKKSEKKWYKVQKSFHRALSYLPQSWFNIEDCPSCAVVKAFANFPKLMKYSPVPPVVVLKLSVVEGMKFIASEIKECSVPCCEIEAHIIDADYFEDEYVNDVRIRELALLKIDLNNLPTIPPWELFEMKNALNEGQKIVKYIYKLSHPDDSSKEDLEPENTNDKEDDEAFRLNYSNALASAIALRFLVRVRYYYPDVLKEEEARKLHDELITHFESAIKNDRLNYINKFYEQPDFEKLKNDDHMDVVCRLLLLSHPDITIIEDDSTENIQKSGEQLAKNLKFADKTVMETIKNLQSIMLFDCKIPKPYDDATFQEPNRFFYILTTYWRLCKTLILKILDQNVDYSSDLLLKLIINIRARIETCLSKLSDISELTEAKEPVLHLLDAIVSCEMRMDMNAVPEYTLGLVEKVDISIEQARLQLGSKIYSLTPIEEFFIEFVEDAISDYHKNSEIAFKGMLKHAQNIPEIKKMEDIESLKLEFPDQYKIINQMIKDGESVDVIKAVLKGKKAEPNGEGINDEKEKPVFRKDGDIWKIVFDGHELPPLKDLDGFHYISYLLQRPNEQITPLDLYDATKGRVQTLAGKVAANITKKHDEHEKDEPYSELSISSGDKLLNTHDEEATIQYKERIVVISEERQKAEGNNDQATIERLDRETKSIEKELRNSGYDKKKKSSTIQGEKARKNVSRRIKDCIKKIYKHNQILGQYLTKNIKTGTKFVYSPNTTNPINWQF